MRATALIRVSWTVTPNSSSGPNTVSVSGTGINGTVTGLNGNETVGFPNYPNPTDGGIYLSFGKLRTGETINLEIIDLSGKPHWSRTIVIQDEPLLIDVIGLNSGLYHVVLSNRDGIVIHQDGIVIQKLIKE